MSGLIKAILILLGIVVGGILLFIYAPLLVPLLIIVSFILLKIKYPIIRSAIGESYVNSVLGNLGQGYTLFYDLYVPDGEGGTLQIDHVVTSPNGIFVIETKHYHGSIFGFEKQEYWTYVKKKKQGKFLNPIQQNKAHMQAIKQFLGKANFNYIHSIIVFSQDATFKFNENFKSTKVLQISQLSNNIKKHSKSRINDKELKQINQMLGQLANVSKREKRQMKRNHLKTIKKTLQTKDRVVISK